MEFENLTRVEQVMYNDEMLAFENGLFHCDSQFISHYTSPQVILLHKVYYQFSKKMEISYYGLLNMIA